MLLSTNRRRRGDPLWPLRHLMTWRGNGHYVEVAVGGGYFEDLVEAGSPRHMTEIFAALGKEPLN